MPLNEQQLLQVIGFAAYQTRRVVVTANQCFSRYPPTFCSWRLGLHGATVSAKSLG